MALVLAARPRTNPTPTPGHCDRSRAPAVFSALSQAERLALPFAAVNRHYIGRTVRSPAPHPRLPAGHDVTNTQTRPGSTGDPPACSSRGRDDAARQVLEAARSRGATPELLGAQVEPWCDGMYYTWRPGVPSLDREQAAPRKCACRASAHAAQVRMPPNQRMRAGLCH